MAIRPCAATDQTILRMTAVAFTAWMMNCFFRFNGQGGGEPCPAHGNWRNFSMFRTERVDSTPGDRLKPMPAGTRHPHTSGFHPVRPRLLPDRLQTQNA
jgi:hypothetical protein